jgi:hypothetical protein
MRSWKIWQKKFSENSRKTISRVPKKSRCKASQILRSEAYLQARCKPALAKAGEG